MGSLYGWSFTEDQSLWNRLPQETPVKNLILAGAWTFPGGGQSTVLLSGYTAGGIVLDDLD
jgi:phytoene dehydrogenase-like protein